MDQFFQSLELAGYSLAYSQAADAVHVFSNKKYVGSQVLYSKELIESMKTYIASYEVVSDMMMYFPETRYVLKNSRFCPIEWAEDYLPSEFGLTGEEIREAAGRQQKGMYLTEDGRSVYFYTKGSENNAGNQILCLFLLNNRALRQMLEMGEENFLFLQMASGEYALLPEEIEKTEIRKASEGLENLKRNYYIREEECDFYEIKLIHALPLHSYRKNIKVMERLLFGYLIVGGIFGLGGVWYVTRKNYRPVRELRDSVVSEEQDQGLDDVEAVHQAFVRLKNAYQESKYEIRQNQDEKKNNQMNHLLKRKVELPEEDLPEEWRKACPGKCFALMGIEILDFSGFVDKKEGLTSETIDATYFVVENVFHEMFEKTALGKIGAETDGKCFFLLNGTPEQSFLMKDEMISVAMEAKKYLWKQFHLLIAVDISQIREGWSQVRNCYLDIERLEEYRDYQENIKEEVLTSDEIIAGKGQKEKTDVSRRSDIQEIAAYINQNFNQKEMTVGYLAELFHMNLSSLSRSFKLEQGVGILEYINRKRIEKAKELIREGYTVKDTALLVGFTDTQPLNRMFRQYVGMTPTEYRSQSKKKERDRSL